MVKRILFIAPQPFFQWRGSPIRIKFNLLAFAKLGFQVDVLTLPIGENIDIDGVTIHRVANPFNVRNIPIGPSLWKIFFDNLIFLKGISLCCKNKYSIIHGVEEAGMIGAILATIFRTKNIFEKHSDPSSYSTGGVKNFILKAYGLIEKITVGISHAVICTGPGLVTQVDAMNTGTKAFNIFDIPSSLEESSKNEIEEKRRELMSKPQEVLITFVGSFAVYQGVDLLFASIPEVVKTAQNARFVIIGGTAEEIEARRIRLEEEGVSKNVTFVGMVPPDILPNYLTASDILLSPRISGVNTPLKILDYMKAGKSIVATDHPSNRLLLNEEEAVFSSPEPTHFSQAILSLVNNEKRRRELGHTCRKTYEESFTFAHHCKRLETCYSYVLDN